MSKEFEVNGVQYIAVELPATAKNIENDDRVLMYDYMDNGFERMKAQLLPATDGTWEIVGLVRELAMNATPEFAQQVKEMYTLNDNSLIIKKI